MLNFRTTAHSYFCRQVSYHHLEQLKKNWTNIIMFVKAHVWIKSSTNVLFQAWHLPLWAGANIFWKEQWSTERFLWFFVRIDLYLSPVPPGWFKLKSLGKPSSRKSTIQQEAKWCFGKGTHSWLSLACCPVHFALLLLFHTIFPHVKMQADFQIGISLLTISLNVLRLWFTSHSTSPVLNASLLANHHLTFPNSIWTFE